MNVNPAPHDTTGLATSTAIASTAKQTMCFTCYPGMCLVWRIPLLDASGFCSLRNTAQVPCRTCRSFPTAIAGRDLHPAWLEFCAYSCSRFSAVPLHPKARTGSGCPAFLRGARPILGFPTTNLQVRISPLLLHFSVYLFRHRNITGNPPIP